MLRFGDRNFYGPWWNCTTMDEYWRIWNVSLLSALPSFSPILSLILHALLLPLCDSANIPTHNWLMKHIHVPLVRAGWSRLQSGLCVFLVSAIFHEVPIYSPPPLLCYSFVLLLQNTYSSTVACKRPRTYLPFLGFHGIHGQCMYPSPFTPHPSPLTFLTSLHHLRPPPLSNIFFFPLTSSLPSPPQPLLPSNVSSSDTTYSNHAKTVSRQPNRECDLLAQFLLPWAAPRHRVVLRRLRYKVRLPYMMTYVSLIM